jgi:hypothetical protein
MFTKIFVVKQWLVEHKFSFVSMDRFGDIVGDMEEFCDVFSSIIKWYKFS